MIQSYKRILPVVLLITGVIVLGLAISLNIYSYFYPKQGVITITLNKENNYSVTQPLFFNYHGYVKIILVNSEPYSRVYVVIDESTQVLDYRNKEITITLDRGGHKLYFNSTSLVILKLKAEDYLIAPGENILLLLTGIGLTIVGAITTIYYAKRKLVPLE